MSCNGCRVLRKGCSDTCILRPCLQWIESSEPQANATVFVAKFFGRAGLMSFISAVPPSQRPALFQSLLFEAAGRTVNPVTGAVGLFRTGNWHVCQEAVETVLRGGTLLPIQKLLEGSTDNEIGSDFPAEVSNNPTQLIPGLISPVARSNILKRRRSNFEDLELSLSTGFPMKGGNNLDDDRRRRPECSGRNSEESITTTDGFEEDQQHEKLARNLLNLFN